VCVFAWVGSTSWRMKRSMKEGERPEAVESAWTQRRGSERPALREPLDPAPAATCW
jgi:hypothetical protein